MNLRDLIKEGRKYLQEPEEDGDFGPVGRAARGAVGADYKPPPEKFAACPAGTVRQKKPDGSSSCVALRGAKHR